MENQSPAVLDNKKLSATAMSPLLTGTDIIEGEIRLRAHQRYERNGFQDGHAEDDWLEAEREIHETLAAA